MRALYIACLLLFSTMVFGQSNPLPQEISEFYRLTNFVSAYTTTSEKSRLVKAINLEELPSAENEEERLMTAFQFIKQLDAMVLKYEDYQYGPLTTLPGLYRVLNWTINDEEITVRVEFYYLDDGMTAELISVYDVFDKYTFEMQDLYKRILFTRESVDLHRWVLANDGWKKDQLNRIY